MTLDLFRSIEGYLNQATWLQQVEALFVIFGLPPALIRWFFYRPKLKLEFDPKETYHTVREVGRNEMTIWVHLMCKNPGFAEVKNASAYVTRVYKINLRDYTYKLYEDFRSQLNLKWAHEDDYEPRNILPRDKRRLDVCFAYRNDPSLYFAAKRFPSGTARTLPPGDYLFEVVVSAVNVGTPAKYLLPVIWNGNWVDIRAVCLPRISSFKLYKPSLLIKPFRLCRFPQWSNSRIQLVDKYSNAESTTYPSPSPSMWTIS